MGMTLTKHGLGSPYERENVVWAVLTFILGLALLLLISSR